MSSKKIDKMLKYLETKYNKAPRILPPREYKISYNFKGKNEKEMQKYLVDTIIKLYKTAPEKQSVWCVEYGLVDDSNRNLMFVIRREIMNRRGLWMIDRNGKRFRDFVVKPLRDHIALILELKSYRAPIKKQKDKPSKFEIIECIKEVKRKSFIDDVMDKLPKHFNIDGEIKNALKIEI
jgi:hypothetical protein